MALTVEDGSVVYGANSFVEEADADSFFDIRGVTAWTVNDGENEAKLVEAADYLNVVYVWPGDRYDTEQGMALPTSALPTIPMAIKQAQMILALEAKSGPLMPSFQGATIKSEEKTLEGVGAKKIEYDSSTPANARRFPMVDALVGPYTVTSVGSSFQTARRLRG